jgi:hypothetical protein
MITCLIYKCREKHNIYNGIEFPFKLIPPSFPLSCLLSLGYYLQLQEGMFLEKGVILS